MTKLLTCLILMLVAVTACGPKVMSARRDSRIDPPQVAISDNEQVTIVVYEHLIREVLTRSPGQLCFVAADDNERRALSSRFPGVTLLPGNDAEQSDAGVRAKKSKKPGLLFSVLSKRIVGNQAFIHAGYLGEGTAVSFDFELKKDRDWKIEKVGNAVTADMFPPPR